jgi:tRNA modification GTPase
VKKDIGIDKLEEQIINFATLNNKDMDNRVLVTNARHEYQLKKAGKFLESAFESIKNGLTLDVVAMDLKSALEELGRITGHHADADVIDAIFSRFCIGK